MTAPDDPGTGSRGSRRGLLAVGAAGAWAVLAVFVVVGDGVEPVGAGVPRLVIEHGHQVVWLLLALSLSWAAWRGRWERLSSGLAIAALVVYGLFLLAVLTAT